VSSRTSPSTQQETFYFGAGPATLPKLVLEKIKNELVEYGGTGLSILELSHRSDAFMEILDQAESLLRELMEIPQEYAVLLLHGGATAQYSMMPLNFLNEKIKADYVCTGHWSVKAYEEATKFGRINVIDALVESEKIALKPLEQWGFSKKAQYLHYCDNETINGVTCDLASKFSNSLANNADINDKNLFCDMTSSILTRSINVSDYGLIYASAQKNLGVAGLCVMVVKKEILAKTNKNIPRVFDYQTCFENRSLTNTPPTFAVYVLLLMLNWLETEGGVPEIEKRSQKHANAIYSLIDASELYKNNVEVDCRSNINIPFVIKDEVLQTKFLQHAEKCRLLGLRGHKAAGGVRISLYNAMPQQGVDALIGFMRDFELNH